MLQFDFVSYFSQGCNGALGLWKEYNRNEVYSSYHTRVQEVDITYFGDVKLDHSMKVVSPMFVLGKITFSHTSVLPEA